MRSVSTTQLQLRLSLLSVLLAVGVSAQPVPRFEPDSTTFPITVPASYASTTGYLVVLEDRARPDGPTVRLPVAIVHTNAEEPASSPVLYLSGGPGTSALQTAAYPGAYPWLSTRDFVVFGQRGTRYAEPALECPAYEAARSVQQQIEAATQCRAELSRQGTDPSAYSTAASAADIEDLRRVLEIEQWTLYGVSYGTRLALAVLRDYPETVRAAVLDSVLPPDARYDDESVQNLAASLDLVFRDCAADAGCNAAYPDLQKRFYEALDRADTTPLEVLVPTDDSPVSRRLNGADLAGLVSLSSAWGITNAPMLIDGIARRDTALIAPRLAAGRGSGLAWGMRLSVWCGEAQPYARRATADGPDGTLNGMESAVVLPAVCDAWNVPVRPKREVEPVSSDVATLLIAGEYDPDTPPAWAYRAATTLTNSRVHVVRGAGHAPIQDWGGDGCAMQVAAAFVADPVREINASAPAGGCLSEREAPSFVLPPEPEPKAEPARYLIYFHGRIVEDGLPAISPRFGEYEYEAILKRFEDEGFTVLSEQRPPNAEVTVHAERAVAQVDSLRRLGVEPASISLVGASKGAYIASLAAHLIEEPELNVVLLAGCSAGVVQYMQAEHIDLYGRVLTVRDIADTELAGSCAEVLAFSDGVSAHEELVVEVGNGHGLIYRPLDAWVKPMLTWIDQ